MKYLVIGFLSLHIQLFSHQDCSQIETSKVKSQLIAQEKNLDKQRSFSDNYFSLYSLCEVCGRVEEFINRKCRTCGTPIRV